MISSNAKTFAVGFIAGSVAALATIVTATVCRKLDQSEYPRRDYRVT